MTRLMNRRRTCCAVAAAALLALAIPVAGAGAATTPAASTPQSPQPPMLTFTPPKVGPLSVDIAPTIINGKVVDPGLHVLMPGTSLPTLNWTPEGWMPVR
jgi:hypothetical protein